MGRPLVLPVSRHRQVVDAHEPGSRLGQGLGRLRRQVDELLPERLPGPVPLGVPGPEEDPVALAHVGLGHVLGGDDAAGDLDDAVLVGHDWGGPIGVGAARREKSRYTNLVLLNTLTEAPMTIPRRYWLPFHALLRMDRVADPLVKERNLFQRIGVSDMEEADQQVYLEANDSPETRAGIAAFPRMIPYDRDHPNYPLLDDILADLETWDIPALLLFSDGDTVFSPEQGERLVLP